MSAERYIDLQLIKPLTKGSGNKGKISLTNLLKEYFNKLNVGYLDPCCPTGSDGAFNCPAISAQENNAITCNPDGLYSPTGESVDANNGLTLSSGFVQLGGALVNTPTTITGSATGEKIIFNGVSNMDNGDYTDGFIQITTTDIGFGDVALGISTTANGIGIQINNSDIGIIADAVTVGGNFSGGTYGVLGQSNGTGGNFNGNTYGIHTISANGSGAYITNITASQPTLLVERTNTNGGSVVQNVATFRESTVAVVGAGRASTIDIQPPLPASQIANATRIVAKWTNVASPTSETEIWGMNANVATQLLTIKADSNGRVGIGSTITSPTARLHLPAGSTTSDTAPLKFTSGALMTTPAAGAMEFLTDKAYLTITTGTARKEFTLNDAALVTDRIPFTTTNGRLSSSANLSFFNSFAQFVVTDQVGAAILYGAGASSFNSGSTTIGPEFNLNSDNSVQLRIAVGASADPTSGYPNNAYLKTTNAGKLFIDTPIINLAVTTGVYVGGAITNTPTAKLHIGAGTTTAGSAPIKLTSGTNMTTAETGAIEYNGTNLFFTRTGTTRENVLVGNSGAAAPSTSIGATIVNFYGSSATNFLGDPNSWASVVIGGTTYKIPLYT